MEGSKERGRRRCLDVLLFCIFFYFGKNSHSPVTEQRRFTVLCSAGGCSAPASHESWCSSERYPVGQNGSWPESGTHAVRYPSFSTAPKRRNVAVSHGQRSLWRELSSCLPAGGRPLIRVPPGNPVWFSLRFCCRLMAVFELALVSVNLSREASVKEKTSPDSVDCFQNLHRRPRCWCT